jgi:hypothetical protein
MKKIQLNLERPIAFYPQLAKALGGIEEAIFIQQLYYWSDKGVRGDGYIYKTKKEWQEETTLTPKQQDRIVRKLKGKKIIETKLEGIPATLHYKLDSQLLQKVITSYDKRYELLTETTTETTLDITKVISADINEIVNNFQGINPSYEKFFSNKTQRSAVERLLEKYGKAKILHIMQFLPETNQEEYAPVIISPLQLEDKLASLLLFLKRKQKEKKEIATF